VASEVFIDSAFLIALLRLRDEHHQPAKALAARLAEDGRLLVTTDAVVLEFANFFARLPARTKAIATVGSIRADPGWRVERLEEALMGRAQSRYRRFADKDWSLTDCISMEVMGRRGIREVATTDQGFAQAGFAVLL
jgi:predicted nucleic acid-binding protein